MRLLRLGFTLFLLLGVAMVFTHAQDRTHTVQTGETLTSIARQYNVSVEAILVRNSIIDPNRIRRGQTLLIPTGALTPPRTHTVQPAESLNDLAIRYNTTVEALRQANNLTTNTLRVGQVITLPAVGGATNYARTYQIDRGDTLRSVAERFGTTWQVLAYVNNIPNANAIQAGQVITIPPAGTTVPTPAPVVVNPPVVVTPAPVVTAPQPTRYVMVAGDTLNALAERFGVTLQALNRANGITNARLLQVGTVLIIPPRTVFGTGGPVVTQPPVTTATYTVLAGDTMFSIAARAGVNIYTLAQLNGILNLNAIYTGQVLRLR